MFTPSQQKQNAALLDMDIQQEEIAEFFRDYWKPIVGMVLVLVLLTAGIQIYRSGSERVAGEQMAVLLPLSAAAPTAQNAKLLEDYAETGATGGRRALALLFAASQYQSSGKPEDARRVLDRIITQSGPEEIKNYARVLMVNMGGDLKTLDAIPKKSAWQTAAAEIRALAETDAQKRRDAYALIAIDPKTPPAMRSRAAEFSGQTSVEE